MYYGQEFYLPGANIPEIFLEADRIMHKKIEKEHPEWLIKRAQPKKVPMPIIEAKPKNGPLYCTEEWYFKKKRKQQIKKAKAKKEIAIDVMEIQARLKFIRGKLAKLDPTKKKDLKKIVDINEEIEDLKCALEAIERTTGKPVKELEEGSKIQRIFNWIKMKAKSIKKKFDNWVDRNEDLICGILSVGIPLFVYGIFQAIFKVPPPVTPPIV